MFYGSGAGKLPTASAVVADVVDEAKHLNRNIMMHWSSKKLELMDISQVKGRFFVRVQGTPEEKESKVKELFGEAQIWQLADMPEEFAFVTPVMTEAQYKEKAGQLDGIISMIRARI